MDLENDLNQWMTDHETEIFELISEADAEFTEAHPGADRTIVQMNVLSMANRRFVSRALGAVLPKYLPDTKQS